MPLYLDTETRERLTAMSVDDIINNFALSGSRKLDFAFLL